jgi:hypothetical protein
MRSGTRCCGATNQATEVQMCCNGPPINELTLKDWNLKDDGEERLRKAGIDLDDRKSAREDVRKAAFIKMLEQYAHYAAGTGDRMAR